MFTGIIQQVGAVVGVRGGTDSRVLSIDAGPLAEQIGAGDSVCVDGVCLTATAREGETVEFDVGAETFRLTTLSELSTGDAVNLEPALRASDRLGGHFVSGHVDGTGVIRRMDRRSGEVRLAVEVPDRLTDLMVVKGSVAVQGISLTVADLRAGRFEVSLVPYTLRQTTLSTRGAGDPVNIECDMIGRWIRKLLPGEQGDGGSLTIDRLEESGF